MAGMEPGLVGRCPVAGMELGLVGRCPVAGMELGPVGRCPVAGMEPGPVGRCPVAGMKPGLVCRCPAAGMEPGPVAGMEPGLVVKRPVTGLVSRLLAVIMEWARGCVGDDSSEADTLERNIICLSFNLAVSSFCTALPSPCFTTSLGGGFGFAGIDILGDVSSGVMESGV